MMLALAAAKASQDGGRVDVEVVVVVVVVASADSGAAVGVERANAVDACIAAVVIAAVGDAPAVDKDLSYRY